MKFLICKGIIHKLFFEYLVKMSVPGFYYMSPSIDLIHAQLYNSTPAASAPSTVSVGLMGEQGPQGNAGPQGEQGPKGDAGKDGTGLVVDASGNTYSSNATISKGKNNVILGANAGKNLSGNNNILIGEGATPTISTINNEIVLGNSSIKALRCQQTSIAGLSDARDKTDVVNLDGTESLRFLSQIQPVEFVWDQRVWYDSGVSDGSKRGELDFGFLAQQLLSCEARPSYKIVSTQNPERYEVAPGRLIPLLVSALNELARKVDVLEKRITN